MSRLKKYIKIVLCILAITATIFLLYESLQISDDYELNIDCDEYTAIKHNMYDSYIVTREDLAVSASWEANVVSDVDSYISYFHDRTETEMLVNVAQIIKKGDVIFKTESEFITSDQPGICISAEETEASYIVELLSFENLYFEAEIPDSYIYDDLSHNDFIAEIDGEEYKVVIDSIAGQSNDGKILVRFVPDDGILDRMPGEKAEISTVFEVKDNVLTAPISYIVYYGDDKYYVYLDVDGQSIITEVKIGSISEDYLEIKYGINEGDRIYPPEEAESLKRYLENE